MEQIILIVHVLIALAIIGLIMIQQGKGADMGASFGAGASQTLFGSSGGGSVLTSATAWLVTLFFATSFGLAVIAKNGAIEAGAVDIPVPAVVEAPADLPAEDIPAFDSVEASDTAVDFDVPEIDGSIAPVTEGSDVPDM